MIHIAPLGKSNSTPILYLNFGIQNYLARIAVPFFFVCSGFLLYRKTKLSDFSLKPTKRYAQRILKLYLLWSLIYLPIRLRGFYSSNNSIVHDTLAYIRDFIFVGSYTQLWYLNATFFSVIVISFLLYKKVSPKILISIALILYLIGLTAQSWFGIVHPLQNKTPFLWKLLKVIQKVIYTTRNGLFMGIIFMSIGMIFAFYNIKISKRISLLGFVISMLIMFIEVFLLKQMDFAREYDMYLSLLPAVFFLFSLIKQVSLPDNIIYKKLRILSSLIFYTHLWIKYIVNIIISHTYDSLSLTPIPFILILTITILVSMIIVKLSENRVFKWLKNFY
jgi:surface polysaccharide O-acyltransferase-like enzyme